MLEKIQNLIRSFDGPLTRSLHRKEAPFGLGQLPSTQSIERTTTTVCGYCSTGCGLNVHLHPTGVVNLTPDPTYPVNLGMACPKGWEALRVLDATDRGTTPLLRDPKTGERKPISWEEAITLLVTRLRELQVQHGPESAAFLSTGQIPTEEMFLLGSLWKFGMGFLDCDSNTRQCMATAHVAYKQAFGFDAPPFCYEDFEESDVLVFVGANPCIAHPILWERVMRNPRSPEILVVDPRFTETAQAATHHIPLAPKSDLQLWYGVLREVLERGWTDSAFIAEHISGFEDLTKFVQGFDARSTCAAAGLTPEQFEQLVCAFQPGRRTSVWWTMGVNQSHEAVRTAQALINLCLVTGNIGKPGTGANSITGQMNAMGSRLYANTSSLPGGRNFSDAEHRKQIAQLMAVPEEVIPHRPSIAYDQILDKAVSGEIKALWVIATNPAHTWIGSGTVQKARANLDFLVVQDMYHSTETALLADLYLPAAGWGEKEGSQINSERRIGVSKKVARPPGQALSDFDIFRLVGLAWGCPEWLQQFASPETTFALMQKLSVGMPHDFSGIQGYTHIDAAGGIQWPYPASMAKTTGSTPARPGIPASLQPLVRGNEGSRRLFADGTFYTPDGKAKLLFEAPRPPEELPDAEYPFVLLTGRGSSSQWHTGTRTGKSPVLSALSPKHLVLELHSQDAEKIGCQSGDTVCVSSRRGTLEAQALVSQNVRPGNVYLPMHDRRVNTLTFPSFDPYSREPSYKHAAVSIKRILRN